MPEVTVTVGGRPFQVACQAGEEQYLLSAAKILDEEAETMLKHAGRMPEGRMLLMAGLMLADKSKGMAEDLAAAQAELATAQNQLATSNARAAERVEVPTVPEGFEDDMDALAKQAEALLAKVG